MRNSNSTTFETNRYHLGGTINRPDHRRLRSITERSNSSLHFQPVIFPRTATSLRHVKHLHGELLASGVVAIRLLLLLSSPLLLPLPSRPSFFFGPHTCEVIPATVTPVVPPPLPPSPPLPPRIRRAPTIITDPPDATWTSSGAFVPDDVRRPAPSPRPLSTLRLVCETNTFATKRAQDARYPWTGRRYEWIREWSVPSFFLFFSVFSPLLLLLLLLG